MERQQQRRRVFRIETLEPRRLLASDWQNAIRIRDVNGDGLVTPPDALIGINRLNQHGGGQLEDVRAEGLPYFDVSGDQFHSPIDVLLVINSLNSGPLLSAQLANDTTSDSTVDNDGVTRDPAIIGSVAIGHIDQLFGKLGTKPADPWIDLSQFLDSEQRFSISQSQLEQSLGQSLEDGLHTLWLEARSAGEAEELMDRLAISFTLDRTPPKFDAPAEIPMSRSDAIEIPFNEPLAGAFIDLSRIGLYDVTFEDAPTFGGAFPFDGESTDTARSLSDSSRVELEPQAAYITPDGLVLVIVPPASSRSIRYLVDLNGAVTDRAGNPLVGTGSNATGEIRAHYFADDPPELPIGTTVQIIADIVPAIAEFRIMLEKADRLIWSGNQVFGSMTRFDLYREGGELLQSWHSDASLVDSSLDSADMLALDAGQYRLRAVMPPGSGSLFRVYRQSQLVELSTSRSSGNTELWPLDVVRTHLDAGDSLLFESTDGIGSGVPLPLRTLFGPAADQLTVATVARNRLFVAEQSGEYVLVLNRVGYRVHRSPLVQKPLEVNQWISGNFTRPGERVRYSYATSPGELYMLETDDALLAVSYDTSEGRSTNTSPLGIFSSDSVEASVIVSSLSADAQAASYRFRLVRFSDSPQLPLETPLTSGTRDDGADVFQLSITAGEQTLAIEGNVAIEILQLDRNQLLSRSEHSGGESVRKLEPGLYYFLVSSPGESETWQAEFITSPPVRALLPEGAIETRFPTGEERYEFTFQAAAGDVYRYENLLETWSMPRLDLIGPGDVTIFDFQADQWRVPHTGTYKLVVRAHWPNVNGFTFRFSPELSGLPLVIDQLEQITVPVSKRLIYRFTAIEEQFFLHWFKTSGDLPYWQILNADQHPVANGSLRIGDNSITATLEAGRDYWLVLSSSASSNVSYEFVWRTPERRAETIELGQRISGDLAGAGDSVTLAVELKKGAEIRFEELELAPGIEARWLDLVPEVVEARGRYIAATDGVYHLQLKNAGSSNARFAIELDNAAPLQYGTDGLAGFDTVYSGSQPADVPAVFTFSVVVGTPYALNAFEGQGLYRVEIVNSAGVIEHQGNLFDSPLLIAQASGTLQVTLSAKYGNTTPPRPFRFQMLSLTSAVEVSLNEVHTGTTVAPNEMRFYRIPLAGPTEVYLDEFPVGGGIDMPLLKTPAEPDRKTDIGLHASQYAVVRIRNYTGQPWVPQFAVRTIDQEVAVGTPADVLVEPGHWTVVRADLPSSDAFSLEVKTDDGLTQAYYVLDDQFRRIPTEGIDYHPQRPGAIYIALLNLSSQSASIARVGIHTHQRLVRDLTVGQQAQGSLLHAGDSVQFTTLLSPDQVTFVDTSRGAVRWTLIGPTGARTPLDGTVLRLPVDRSGVYTIEGFALRGDADYRLKLTDALAERLTPGQSFTADLSPSDSIRTYSIEGQPGQRLHVELQSGDAETVRATDLYGNLLLMTYEHVLVLPASGKAVLTLSGTSPLSAELQVAETRHSDVKLGDWTEGLFTRLGDEHVFHFEIYAWQRVAFEFASDPVFVELIDPYGRAYDPVQFVGRTLTLSPGQYQLRLSYLLREQAADYRWQVMAID